MTTTAHQLFQEIRAIDQDTNVFSIATRMMRALSKSEISTEEYTRMAAEIEMNSAKTGAITTEPHTGISLFDDNQTAYIEDQYGWAYFESEGKFMPPSWQPIPTPIGDLKETIKRNPEQFQGCKFVTI